MTAGTTKGRPFSWRDGPSRPPLLMLLGTGGDERDLTYDTDLTGKWVIIANSRNDPTISAMHTARLAQRLRDLGAEVQLLEHEAGHTINPTQIPEIAASLARRAEAEGIDTQVILRSGMRANS